MYKYLVFIFALGFVSCSHPDPKEDEQVILNMLKAQEAAWNKADLVGFMKGYWQNDSLLFVGQAGPNYGYNATLLRYQKSYPDAEHMGHFTSTILSMKRVSDDCYFILGKWELKRTIGDAAGTYTLLLRKINNEWVIVADHSS